MNTQNIWWGELKKLEGVKWDLSVCMFYISFPSYIKSTKMTPMCYLQSNIFYSFTVTDLKVEINTSVRHQPVLSLFTMN